MRPTQFWLIPETLGIFKRSGAAHRLDAWNLAGALTAETYPSTAVVSTTYDAANGPTQVTKRSTTYLTVDSYAPSGGLDHFPARHFASTMGRFMRPDPVGNFVADVGNPQS
jgi:YD repeat-containing protein